MASPCRGHQLHLNCPLRLMLLTLQSRLCWMLNLSLSTPVGLQAWLHWLCWSPGLRLHVRRLGRLLQRLVPLVASCPRTLPRYPRLRLTVVPQLPLR